jgi:hypothetical protein
MQNDRLFFSYNEGDDLEERYEELLFEDKQFFTNKAIVPKVYRARIEKIKKREDAYRRISKTESDNEHIELNLFNENSSDLMQNYLAFQKDKSTIMHSLFQVRQCNSLIEIIELYMNRYLAYLQNWKLNELGDTDGVLIAKEQDPTNLYNAIKAFSSAGGKNVNEIQTLFFNRKSLLVNEAKRLSLLLQKEIQ